MLNTPAKFTRLELVIIIAALVVLVFSNRPPESGNASVRNDIEPVPEAQTPASAAQPQSGLPTDTVASESFSPGSREPDNSAIESVPQPAPRPKRIAMVDARKCDALKYPNIMYGEVTVSRVWNGTTFEWRKVCEVKEKDGTTSVWSFDDRHEGVTISELPPDPAPTNYRVQQK